MVAAVFPWFGRSGRLSRAEQRFIAESPWLYETAAVSWFTAGVHRAGWTATVAATSSNFPRISGNAVYVSKLQTILPCALFSRCGATSPVRGLRAYMWRLSLFCCYEGMFSSSCSRFSLNSRVFCFYVPSSSPAAWLACLFSEMLLRRAQIKPSVYIQEATPVHTDVCSLLRFDSFVSWR